MVTRRHFESSLYKEHATAIGWMSMRWALLEAVLDRHLLRALVPLDPSDLCNAVTSQIDFRAKIQIAITVGHLKKPDDAWFSELETVLNHVDNELRPKRNRLIHDPIVTQLKAPNSVVRAQTKSTLKKPRSRSPRELITYTEEPITPEEIWATADAIEAATKKIGLLAGALRKLRNATR